MPKTPHLPSADNQKSDRRAGYEPTSLQETDKDLATKASAQIGRSSMLRRPVTPNNNPIIGYKHQNKMPLTELERELLEMSCNEDEPANLSK